MRMLTHGTVALLTTESEFTRRIPGYGHILSTYLKELEIVLDRVYAAMEVDPGERSLVISLAPGDQQQHWVVRPGVGEMPDESEHVQRAAKTVHVQGMVLQPVLLASAFWSGTERVEIQSFGTQPEFTVPEALRECASDIARAGGTPSLNRVVDEYWVRRAAT